MTTTHILNAKKLLQEQVNEVDNAIANCEVSIMGFIAYQNGVAFSKKAHKYIRAFNKELRLREDRKTI